MDRRRKRRREATRLFKKIKLIWIIKSFLYALGVYSFFYSEGQFARTLISMSTVITIGIILGVIASFIIERDYKYYLFSTIFFGSLFTGAFFRLNRLFAHHEEVKITERILYKTLSSPKSEYSRVTIGHDGYNKDVSIPGDQESYLANSAFLVMTCRKGIFGYYIIIDRDLSKK